METVHDCCSRVRRFCGAHGLLPSLLSRCSDRRGWTGDSWNHLPIHWVGERLLVGTVGLPKRLAAPSRWHLSEGVLCAAALGRSRGRTRSSCLRACLELAHIQLEDGTCCFTETQTWRGLRIMGDGPWALGDWCRNRFRGLWLKDRSSRSHNACHWGTGIGRVNRNRACHGKSAMAVKALASEGLFACAQRSPPRCLNSDC